MAIQKVSKKRIKYLQSLKLKKYRQKYAVFLLEGRKAVREVIIDKSLKIRNIYAVASWIESSSSLLIDRNFDLWEVSDAELKQISTLKTADSVLAECELKRDDYPPKANTILYLDRISDPGNLGTIVRTADWFGASMVICSPKSVDIYNPKAVQASKGSIGRVPLVVAEPAQLATQFPEHTWYSAGLIGQPLNEISLASKSIFVLGNESQGVLGIDFPNAVSITIPAHPNSKADSLNVAMAASIILYTSCRHNPEERPTVVPLTPDQGNRG